MGNEKGDCSARAERSPPLRAHGARNLYDNVLNERRRREENQGMEWDEGNKRACTRIGLVAHGGGHIDSLIAYGNTRIDLLA